MKQVMSFKITAKKPRNPVAQAMFDRDGCFKPKSVKSQQYKRHAKNQRDQEWGGSWEK